MKATKTAPKDKMIPQNSGSKLWIFYILAMVIFCAASFFYLVIGLWPIGLLFSTYAGFCLALSIVDKQK